MDFQSLWILLNVQNRLPCRYVWKMMICMIQACLISFIWVVYSHSVRNKIFIFFNEILIKIIVTDFLVTLGHDSNPPPLPKYSGHKLALCICSYLISFLTFLWLQTSKDCQVCIHSFFLRLEIIVMTSPFRYWYDFKDIFIP